MFSEIFLLLFCRLGSRSIGFIRSEAEVEEIVDNLREMDASEKQMHLMAVQTPRLLNNYERRIRFIDNNGLIRDIEQFEKERIAAIIWSEKEKQIFREKFALHPKDFEKIADSLELKDCSDCVLFYYQYKKQERFKSSKSKSKKKGKLNRSGQIMSLKIDHGKQRQNKQGKENVEEEEEDLSEEDNVIQNDNLDISQTTETSKDSKFESEAIPATTIAPVIIETPKISQQQQIKVFNTRSGKHLAKAIPAIVKPVSSETSTDEVMSTANSETLHPPLKITIVVTSPSYATSSTSIASVASIVSETVTAAGVLAELTVDNTVNEYPMKVEDLIRQHLNKMPG